MENKSISKYYVFKEENKLLYTNINQMYTIIDINNVYILIYTHFKIKIK